MTNLEKVSEILAQSIGAQRIMADHLGDLSGVLTGMRRQTKPSGFRDGGEFLAALRRAGADKVTDPRLMTNAVGTYAGEAVGTDAGFLMPDDHADEVLLPVLGSGSLLGAFNPMPASSGMVRLVVDETSEWGTGGVTVTVMREGEPITATKGTLRRVNVMLHKVPALTHVSEELISDSPGYARYVWAAHGRKIRNAIEALIISGTGQDQPLGILNAPALITVSKETSQTAGTIVAANVEKMIGRLAPGSFPQAIWIAHPTALPQIAALGPGIYSPDSPRGPYGAILGRGLYVSEQANSLGAVGDLILCDPTGYFAAIKGPANAATVEFAFDQGLSSFRSSLRIGGVPLLSAPVPARTGNNTLSHVVVLEAR